MNNADRQYFDLCLRILENGHKKSDRTGTGTTSVFGHQMRFDLSEGFPLLTTKRVYWQGIVDELLWFLSGSTNVNDLPERSRQLWEPWALNERGALGLIYGAQWRSWRYNTVWSDGTEHWAYIDQIADVIHEIKANPDSRRHIVSAWNVGELEDMALPPCHLLFQFYVADGKLSCQLYQRSADVFLGLPFNIASYSLLTHMIAQVTGLVPGEFIHTIGDAHIYDNHVDQIKEQMSREPRALPTLSMDDWIKDIDEFTTESFLLDNYNPHPAIKGAVAV